MRKFPISNFNPPAGGPISNGFTQIELLIVMAVLGVLATVLILLLNPTTQFQKARDARRKSDLRQITTYLNAYYQDHNQYPPAGSCTNGSSTECYVFSSNGTSWIPILVSSYARQLPVDPLNTGDPRNTGNYSYAYGNVSSDGQHYDLFTQLEYQSDSQRCGLQNYTYEIGLNPPNGKPLCPPYSNNIYALDQ